MFSFKSEMNKKGVSDNDENFLFLPKGESSSMIQFLGPFLSEYVLIFTIFMV